MHVSILYIFFLFKIAYYGIFMIDSLGVVGVFFPIGQIGSSETFFASTNEMCKKKGCWGGKCLPPLHISPAGNHRDCTNKMNLVSMLCWCPQRMPWAAGAPRAVEGRLGCALSSFRAGVW